MPTVDPFEVRTEFTDIAEMTLTGKLDTSTLAIFQTEVETSSRRSRSASSSCSRTSSSIADVGTRVLLFARQRMDVDDRSDIYAVAPQPSVREALLRADPDQEDINVVESYDPFRDADQSARSRPTRGRGQPRGRELAPRRHASADGPRRRNPGSSRPCSFRSATQTVTQTGDERVEVHRAGRDPRVGAHVRELGVDVIDLEREMSPTRVLGAGARAGAASGSAGSPERLEVQRPAFQEDDLVAIAERHDSRTTEAEVARVEPLVAAMSWQTTPM